MQITMDFISFPCYWLIKTHKIFNPTHKNLRWEYRYLYCQANWRHSTSRKHFVFIYPLHRSFYRRQGFDIKSRVVKELFALADENGDKRLDMNGLFYDHLFDFYALSIGQKWYWNISKLHSLIILLVNVSNPSITHNACTLRHTKCKCIIQPLQKNCW